MPVPPEVQVSLQAIADGAAARDLETETLEFKTEITRSIQDALKDLAEATACMANGRGGVVVVGVHDRATGRDAIEGCTLDGDLVRHRIFELTDPGLVVSVDQVDHANTQLLVITIPMSPTVHAVSGRSHERLGSSCVPMNPARIATVVSERRGDDWSAHDSEIAIHNADAAAIGAARTLLERMPDQVRRGFAQQTDADLLRALGVVTARSTFTHAGALLFGPPLERREEIAYIYRRSPAGALAVNEHLSGPMLPTIQRVFELIDVRLERTSVNVGNGQQLQLADLPETAVREAIVNAVMHRDYRRAAHIVVEHSPTRFTVTSPGSFVSGVTPENVLTTSSRTRNPQLAAAVRTLGLAENAGTGVDRMYAAMARIGHQPPTYDADAEQVRVTLLGGAPNTYVARFTASLPADHADDADTMLLLLRLLERRTVNAASAAPMLQRSLAEAQSALERLSAGPAAFLEPTRESARRAQPNYRLRGEAVAALGPAVTYNRRAPDEYDRKVIGMVRESGQINARMIRILLDLDAAGASRVLTDLVGREVLVKTSQSQRGPAVTYGPGPKFPSRR